MATLAVELTVSRRLKQALEQARAAIARLSDRVERADLEKEARFGGTLLAAVATAERALVEAPDIESFQGAVAAYLDRLGRAQAALSIIQSRAGLAPADASATPQG